MLKNFVCKICDEDELSVMIYELKDDEKDVEEVECWVCGGKATLKGEG